MVDLHIYSKYSCGSTSVREILEKAQKLNLDLISITDYNTVNAYHEIEQDETLSGIFSGKIITGCEMLTVYKNNFIKLLGYGFDKDRLKLINISNDDIQSVALRQLIKMANYKGIYFKDNLTLKKDGMSKYAYYVFVKALIVNGLYKSLFGSSDNPVEEFYYRHYTNPTSLFYFDECAYYDDAVKVINNIHSCGGVVSLSCSSLHMFDNGYDFIEEVVSSLSLDIIECEYPELDKYQKEFLRNLSVRYNKYVSGGSGCYSLNDRINVTVDMVNEWTKPLKNVLSLKK